MTTRAQPRRALFVTAGLLLALTAAALLVGNFAADVPVQHAVLDLASPAVLAVVHVVNYAGEWKVLLPATLVLLLVSARARARWWVWILLMVAAPIAETALKHLVGRPRPESVAPGFPSGHATAAAAFCGAVVYLAADLPPAARAVVRLFALVSMLLVAVGRVMLRAHWPSDVLGGIALGFALASIAALIAEDDGREPRPRAG